MPLPPLTSREQLYVLLDENYERCYDGRQFWRGLQALDNELTPGCIHVEPFKGEPAKHLISEEDTNDSFMKGAPTLVFRVRHKEAAVRGAQLLNRIFDDCSTEFIPEYTTRDGVETCQIRSNIDKRHWEKLCLFCSYRFDREVTALDEKDKLSLASQKALKDYTRGTDASDWQSIAGVPAFCMVMGLHGNLRPKEHYKPDRRRKQRELNEPHPRGTPRVFQGIVMHVNMRKSGSVEIVPYAYDIGFDPGAAAAAEASGGDPYWHLLLETFGGNPVPKMPASRRAINTIGLGLGTYGLIHYSEDLIGIIGPVASAATAGVCLVVTYIDYRHKFIDRVAEAVLKRSKSIAQKRERIADKNAFTKVQEDVLPIDAAIAENCDLSIAPMSEEFGERVMRAALARMSALPPPQAAPLEFTKRAEARDSDKITQR